MSPPFFIVIPLFLWQTFYNSCKYFQQAVELAAQGFTEMDGKPIVQVIKNTKAYTNQEKKRRKVIKT